MCWKDRNLLQKKYNFWNLSFSIKNNECNVARHCMFSQFCDKWNKTLFSVQPPGGRENKDIPEKKLSYTSVQNCVSQRKKPSASTGTCCTWTFLHANKEHRLYIRICGHVLTCDSKKKSLQLWAQIQRKGKACGMRQVWIKSSKKGLHTHNLHAQHVWMPQLHLCKNFRLVNIFFCLGCHSFVTFII